MHRSYLHIKDLNILENEKIFTSDSIILDIYDANKIFADFEKYQSTFDKLIAKHIKIYLRLDCENIRNTYKALDQTIGKYIGGFVIDNPTNKVMRRFTLKARDYELKQRLRYRAIDFLVIVNDLDNFLNLKKIIKNVRVRELGINEGYYQEEILDLARTYKKDIVSLSKITTNVNDIESLNQEYNITIDNINKSLAFINMFKESSKEEQKFLLKDNSLRRHYHVLKLGKKLGLIDNYPIIMFESGKKKERIIKKESKMKSFYTIGEEIGNAVTHGVGVGFAISAIILLIIKGLNMDAKALTSYIIFSVSALLLYLMSTIYHSLGLGTKAKGLFRKFDHLTIYFLIAGTYTPFTLLAIGGNIGFILCIALWISAIIGTLFTVFAFGRFRALHIFLYVALGWIAIFFLPQIISNLELGGVILLVAGGIAYTLGLTFYALKVFKYTHMVWHIFVIIGTVLHFLAIYFYL